MTRAGFTLGELAEALQARLDGDPARIVTGVAPLDSAGPDQISFLTDARYHAAARASRAGAFLAAADVADLPAPTLRCAAAPAGVDRPARCSSIRRLRPRAASTAPRWWRPRRSDRSDRVGRAAHRGGGGARSSAPVCTCTRWCTWAPAWRSARGAIVHPHVSLREGVRLGRRVDRPRRGRAGRRRLRLRVRRPRATGRSPRWAAW